jgi:pimeloyl-ACP methyl ester carboxylesterase
MKKIVFMFMIMVVVVAMINLAVADDHTLKLHDQNESNISYQNQSNIKIICSSTSWIDPVSPNKHERNATIKYNITGNFNGTVVPEVSNNKSTYQLKPLNTTQKTGSFVWNGEIDGKMINQAENPYYITLILKDTNGMEVTRSVPNKIFVGRPVLILHGLFQVSQDMEDTKLFKNLSKTHYTESVEYLPPCFQDEVGSALGDIRNYGSNLKMKIRAIKQATGAERVDIVGYSMGGLVARWYYQELGGSASTGKIIMLGTPNHGAESPDPDIFDDDKYSNTAVVQMKPHSSFIQKLNRCNECYCPKKDHMNNFPSNGYITMASKKYVTWGHEHLFGYEIPFVAWGDLVVPYWSVRLPGVYNEDVHTTHLSLPEDREVVEDITVILNTNDNNYNISPFCD